MSRAERRIGLGPLLLAWALGACAAGEPPPAGPAPEDPTSSPAEDEGEPRGDLVLQRIVEEDAAYPFGAVTLALVDRDDSPLFVDQLRLAFTCAAGDGACRQARYTLPPGEYRVTTVDLVCQDQNCQRLLPGRDACAASVGLLAGATITVTGTVAQGKGCRVDLR